MTEQKRYQIVSETLMVCLPRIKFLLFNDIDLFYSIKFYVKIFLFVLGNLEMPDAMEIIFQTALSAGKSGAVSYHFHHLCALGLWL